MIVLVVTTLDAGSAIALERACAMTRLLGGRLVVLHVPAPSSGWLGKLRAGSSSVSVHEVRGWCADLASDDDDETLSNTSVLLKHGSLHDAVVHSVAELDASLIVLGECARTGPGLFREGFHGAAFAVPLVRATHKPVLVARPKNGGGVIAATDFSVDDLTELRQGARLGARVHAPVAFVHNVDTSDYVAKASVLGIPIHASVPPTDADVERRAARLQRFAEYVDTHIEALCVSRPRAKPTSSSWACTVGANGTR